MPGAAGLALSLVYTDTDNDTFADAITHPHAHHHPFAHHPFAHRVSFDGCVFDGGISQDHPDRQLDSDEVGIIRTDRIGRADQLVGNQFDVVVPVLGLRHRDRGVP